MMTQLSTHFTLEELTRTEVRQFANEPDARAVDNLRRLAQQLELVRYTLGAPVLISSGFRSVLVNQAVGGAMTSKHILGCAADFRAPGFGTPLQVAEKIAEANIGFDQLIHEFGRWVHFGIASDGATLRHQLLTIDRHGTQPGLLEIRP